MLETALHPLQQPIDQWKQDERKEDKYLCERDILHD
jgi:hypothetical protein